MKTVARKSKSLTAKKAKRKYLAGMWRHKKTGSWYFSKMKKGERKHVHLQTKSFEIAIQRAREIKKRLDLLKLPTALDQEIDLYLKARAELDEFSRFSQKQRPYVLKQFSSWIGGKTPVSDITTEKLAEYYKWQQHRVSNLTKRPLREVTIQSYIVSVLSPFFQWLMEEGKLYENPADELRMKRISNSVRETPIDAELRDRILAESCQPIPHRILPPDRARWIAFALHCGFEAGLRKNEIIEARPDWFNLASGIVRVKHTATFRPKDREDRVIPLTTVFREFLKTYPLEGKTFCIGPEEGSAEVGQRKSEYRYDFERPYKTMMRYIGEKIGRDLTYITPHALRRAFASLRASAGVSLYKIAVWLGDSETTTARHYAHLQAEDQDINLSRTDSQTLALKKVVGTTRRRKTVRKKQPVRKKARSRKASSFRVTKRQFRESMEADYWDQ